MNCADVKNGMEGIFFSKNTIDSYLLRLLLSCRTIPHAGKMESPSELIGNQIRSSITMTNKKMWYKNDRESSPEKLKFIVQKKHNTLIIAANG